MANMEEKFKPATRVAGQNQDVWYGLRCNATIYILKYAFAGP